MDQQKTPKGSLSDAAEDELFTADGELPEKEDLLIEDISVEEELKNHSHNLSKEPSVSKKAYSAAVNLRNGVMIALFVLILLTGGIIGILPYPPKGWDPAPNSAFSKIPFRPRTSDLEKRSLTEFPSVSKEQLQSGEFWKSFMDGDFLDQLQTWYADTYPEREDMIYVYSEVKHCYGFKDEEVIGLANGNGGDEIPSAPLPTEPDTGVVQPTVTPAAPTEDPTGEGETSTENRTEPGSTEPEETSPEQSETEPEPTKLPEPTPEPPTIPSKPEETMPPAVEGEGKFGGIFVSGDTAYSMYYFSLEGANNYIAHMNNIANALNGTTNVYCMLLPTSCYYYMSDAMKAQYGVANEYDAINYMYGSMNANVHKVDVVPTLQNHIDEYLFFRTDHHWTQLGAYYAYREYASVKGIAPHNLDYYTPMAFPGFLGTFYSETQSPRLAANPDTVFAYVPQGTNRIEATDVNGQVINWPVINDVSTYNKYNKYATFICGDKPFSKIENPQITDGSSCLVIKESFGNAFVPFMVDHYQYTYIIDYRYNNTDGLVTFCKTHNVTDLIYANVAELITPSSVAKMNSMLY